MAHDYSHHEHAGRGDAPHKDLRRARAPLKDILGYDAPPLVSVDFKDDPRSAIVDAPPTMVVDGTCVKVLAWLIVVLRLC